MRRRWLTAEATKAPRPAPTLWARLVRRLSPRSGGQQDFGRLQRV